MISSTLLLVGGIAAVFIAIFAGLVAIGGATNESRGVSKSLAVVEAFTAAPRPLQDELDPSFKERVLTPLLDRFTGLGRKLTPGGYADRLRRKLDLAGNPAGWTADRVIAMKVLGLVILAVIGGAYTLLLHMSAGTTLVATVLGGVLGYYAPNIYLSNVAGKRAQLMQRKFPDAMDLLTISVEAGLGFDAALQHVAKHTQGPLAEEFSRVLQEMQIGLGRGDALRALGERTSLEEMRGFTSAMVQADAFGIPIAQVLRVQSSEIRTKRRQRAEAKAQQLPVKILFPLMFFILPCLFLVVMGPAAISMIELFDQM